MVCTAIAAVFAKPTDNEWRCRNIARKMAMRPVLGRDQFSKAPMLGVMVESRQKQLHGWVCDQAVRMENGLTVALG